MMGRRSLARKLWLEELEGRVVPSAAAVLGESLNWSGYAVQAPTGSVTAVSGKWVVPTVTGSGYSATWVGIDGYSSPTVEQIGTEADISGGRTTYYAWYEMYPANSVEISMTVKPGDTIAAQVSFAAGKFTLSIQDLTRNESYTTTQSGNYQQSSAEWIVEAPSSGNILPLDNFGTETISAAQATIGGTPGPIDNSTWKGTTVNQINMESQSGKTEDTTSGLTDSGSPSTSSFTVTFDTATSTGGGGGGGGRGGRGGRGGGWFGRFGPDAAFYLDNASTLVTQLATPAVVPSAPASLALVGPTDIRPTAQFDIILAKGSLGGNFDLLSGANLDDGTVGPMEENQPAPPAERQTPTVDRDAMPRTPTDPGEARSEFPSAPALVQPTGTALFADASPIPTTQTEDPMPTIVTDDAGGAGAEYLACLLAAVFVDAVFITKEDRASTRRRSWWR